MSPKDLHHWRFILKKSADTFPENRVTVTRGGGNLTVLDMMLEGDLDTLSMRLGKGCLSRDGSV